MKIDELLSKWSSSVDKEARLFQRIAIVGAGAAGLVAGQVLTTAGFEVSVFEESSDIGGVWRTKPGNAMYQSLRTNLPKEIMAINAENPFEESISSSFIGPEIVTEYLETFAKKYSLHSKVSFNHKVISIQKQNLSNLWEIICETEQLKEEIYFFDAVLVCNGHFSLPSVPSIKGLTENFSGRLFHSKDYDRLKSEGIFRSKKILVIGSRSSGTDIARELSHSSLNNVVYVSDRNYFPSSSEKTVYETQDLRKLIYFPEVKECLADHSLLFSNDSRLLQEEIDIIIFCTGYLYDYPFFPVNTDGSSFPVRLEDNHRRLTPLYQLMISIEDPSLVFLGLPFLVIPFPLFFYQALYIAALYLNLLPSFPCKEKQFELLASYEKNYLGKKEADQETSSNSNSNSSSRSEKESKILYYTGNYHYLGSQQFVYYQTLVQEVFHAILSRLDSDPLPKTEHKEEYYNSLSNAISKESLELLFQRELSYISLIEELYYDNIDHRPSFVGESDSYRERRYHIDRYPILTIHFR
jgi:thioredoxin reductase